MIACLFDFDYTLVDSSQGIVSCFQNVLKGRGYTEISDDEIRQTIGKTLSESFRLLTGVTDREQIAAMLKEYSKHADVLMNDNTIIYDDTVSTLCTLKQRGVKVGIVSTKYRFRIESYIKLHFPADFFDIIIGGEDVTTHKPSPEGILLALKRLKLKPKKTVYIGDNTVDAQAAQAAGVNFAAVLTGTTMAEQFQSLPHLAIMDRLSELPDMVAPQKPKKNSWLQLSKWKAVLRLMRMKRRTGTLAPEIDCDETIICRNCTNEFLGYYCNRCGQEAETHRFKFKSTIRNAMSGFSNIDRGFGYTLASLLYRPGYLIADFIAGKRVRYFKPFQTMFVLAAVYIVMVQIIDPAALKKDKYSEAETEIVADNKTAEHEASFVEDISDDIKVDFADKLSISEHHPIAPDRTCIGEQDVRRVDVGYFSAVCVGL